MRGIMANGKLYALVRAASARQDFNLRKFLCYLLTLKHILNMGVWMIESSRFKGMCYLGISGLLSALVLFFLASQHAKGIESSVVSSLLLLIQWHMLGITVCKFGVDNAAFVILSRNQDIHLPITPLLRFPVLPLAMLFTVLSSFVFSPEVALLLFVAMVCDALATFRAAELNAKQMYAATALGNIFNYPVMLALLLAISTVKPPTLIQATTCFATSSVIRFAWLNFVHSRSTAATQPATIANVPLVGMQGLANWMLFRSDQIALIYLPFLISSNQNPDWLSHYLFLTRIPEISTGMLLLVGTVYFPKYFIANPNTDGLNKKIFKGLAIITITLSLTVYFVTSFALRLFNGPEIPTTMAIPFIVQVPLVFMANLVTYSMQSQGHLPKVVHNALLSAVVGAIGIGMMVTCSSAYQLGWLVPLQLTIFICLGLFLSWGSATKLHNV